MLHHLHLKNVGPAPEMRLDLGSRLNLITGDNGLGKSFLLDVAWWALTRRWPHELNRRMTSGYTARPTDPKKPASIGFKLTSKSGDIAYESQYSPRDEAWTGKPGRPWNPGLVIYAHADGSFSVWDPARNYWKRRGNIDVQERLPGYVFTPNEVWDELKVETEGREAIVCNGLIRDWASWIREHGPHARLMKTILSTLSRKEVPRTFSGQGRWSGSRSTTLVIFLRSRQPTRHMSRSFMRPQEFAGSWPSRTCCSGLC